MVVKSKKLKSNSILPLYKQIMMVIFMKNESNSHEMTLKRVSNQLRFSDSTFKRSKETIFKWIVLIKEITF